MSKQTGQTWVLFITSADEELLNRIAHLQDVRSSRYEIEAVINVRGQLPAGLVPDLGMVRIESNAPIELGGVEESLSVAFRGVTQHLHYTSDAQQGEMDSHSHLEFEPSSDTIAVLIPLGKSPRWWQLAQDRRQSHFQTSAHHEGHTAIGTPYVDRVFRRLYHSRNIVPLPHYDFLTYFEFHRAHEDDFKMLLTELRDVARNPEWTYVELEYEVWMTKSNVM